MLKLLTEMINKEKIKSYCKDDISMIENYDKAIADTTQVWHCHHRRETIFSKSDLIEIGEYYNRPACELIFLTSLEHKRLHNLGKRISAETRKKLSEANKGKHLSEYHKRKIGDATKGTQWFNNGVKSIREKTCPEGFVKGRIKK